MNQIIDIDLVWSSEYELGNSRIDTQHQQLFKLYGQLVEAFELCKGNQIIHAAVHELIKYTHFHFRDEEGLMDRLGYKELASHQKNHNHLLAQAEAFAQELEEGKPVLIYEVLGFIRNWIHNHILEEDMKLKQHLKEWD